MSVSPQSPSSSKQIPFKHLFRSGVISVPAIGLGATFFAYGTQTNLAGFSLLESFLATAFIYAVPGQLIVTEQAQLNASILSVFLSTLLVNMRLLPMTMSLMPTIKHKYLFLNFINAHFVALTTWLGFLKIAPSLEHLDASDKARFYFFFGLFLWNIAWMMSMLGYISGHFISPEIQLALVLANPLYFLLLLLEQAQNKRNFLPVILGAVFLPFATLISLEWSILMAGFFGGTITFLFHLRKKSK